MRINKYIALCGVASRRKAEELILAGRVTVNDEVMTELSYKVDEEKQKTEDLVNEWITEAIPVEHLEMKKDDAIKMGAEAMFIEKYGDIVSVYKIGDVSIELCGGPHVSNTSELGHFKIKKEESSSSGIRRIKAILD